MFLLILQLILTVLIVFISYRFWYLHQQRKIILTWIPDSPRLPFLGSVMEFGKDTTEFLENLLRLSNNPAKSFYFELGLDEHGILTKNHEMMEFLLSSNKMEVIDKSTDYKIFEPWLGTGLLTAPGSKWKQRRRIITPAFHFTILEQFIDVFETNGNILIEKFKEVVGKKSVNINTYVTNCTLDIISESAMGVSVNSQEGKNNDYVQSVKDMCRILLTRAFSAFKRNDYIFMLTADYRDSRRHLKVMHNFTSSIIQNRITEINNKNPQKSGEAATGTKRRLAFLDLLLNIEVDGQRLSEEDIKEEVDTFMFEGHDTTSFAVSMTLFLLANHQEIQILARNEQKEICGENRDKPITLQDLNLMKYLDLVIKESLRLYPSVPAIARQITGDIEYKGNTIPKGAVVNFLIYGINRDPDYHQKPDEFIPERHLTSNGKYFSNIPFSAGPRNCIGQKFALLEMKSVISKVLRNFQLLPADPVHTPILALEAVFKPVNGVNISLKNFEWNSLL